MHTRALDVLVIGAGQAGVALAWFLRRLPFRVLLVDRAARVGDSWRNRYDSLTLFSPRASSALPGMPMPGDPDGYPTKDEVAQYLEAYAHWLRVSIATGMDVTRLSRTEDLFRAEIGTGEHLFARAVVLATGAFQEPAVPSFAARLSPEIVQLTAATYRNPRQLPAGRALVVGDGATGRQIALELVDGREVWLATGRRRVVTPQRILGRDQLWWSERLGLLRASRRSVVGKVLRRLDPFPGMHLTLRRLRTHGVKIAGRMQDAQGKLAVLSNHGPLEIDAVVWSVGYRERTGWVDVAGAKDDSGRFVEWRGVSPVPGLYFVGREWMWSRGSGLLNGVGRDTAYVAASIAERLASGGHLAAGSVARSFS